MAADDAAQWEQARLIPVSGIKGADEQERRATSALLAVLSSVKEFAREILGPLGAPSGSVETYIEVPFDLGSKVIQPDGLIRVRRGRRVWTALVEVKTLSNELKREQLESYLDVAKQEGFDALLSISNEMPAAAGLHPTTVDKRKLRKVALHHLSWTQILSEAIVQKAHRGVSDPEQAWILGELIRYLEHRQSGALEFGDMGPTWVAVRDAATAGTLRKKDDGLTDVVARWDQLISYAALRLGRQVGADVRPHLSRKELADPGVRAEGLIQDLVESGRLDGGIRIPDAIGPILLRADMRRKVVEAAVDIEAPRDGRPKTRINWLVRQLADAPGALRIDAHVARSRTSLSELLSDVRADPEHLVDPDKRDLVRFRVIMSAPMGAKRSAGKGGFIDSVLDLLDAFYESVVQNLKPWTPSAPKIVREKPDEVPPNPTPTPHAEPVADRFAIPRSGWE